MRRKLAFQAAKREFFKRTWAVHWPEDFWLRHAFAASLSTGVSQVQCSWHPGVSFSAQCAQI